MSKKKNLRWGEAGKHSHLRFQQPHEMNSWTLLLAPDPVDWGGRPYQEKSHEFTPHNHLRPRGSCRDRLRDLGCHSPWMGSGSKEGPLNHPTIAPSGALWFTYLASCHPSTDPLYGFCRFSQSDCGLPIPTVNLVNPSFPVPARLDGPQSGVFLVLTV